MRGKNKQDLADALVTAVMNQNMEVFNALLAHDDVASFINMRSTIGGANVTALDMAANIGTLYFVCELLACGAEVNAKDKDKNTALHWASLNGKTEAVQKLLESGATLITNCVGTNAIHDAAKGGHGEVFALLAQRFPAQLDDPNGYGNTPFMRACMYNRPELVENILACHAEKINLDHVNNNGFTVLDIAEGLGDTHKRVVEILTQHNAKHSANWESKNAAVTRPQLLEKEGWQQFLAQRGDGMSLV